jgi:hypothetical protein
VAGANPQAIRHNVVDFNDIYVSGSAPTYRVDNDYRDDAASMTPAYAGLGTVCGRPVKGLRPLPHRQRLRLIEGGFARRSSARRRCGGEPAKLWTFTSAVALADDTPPA